MSNDSASAIMVLFVVIIVVVFWLGIALYVCVVKLFCTRTMRKRRNGEQIIISKINVARSSPVQDDLGGKTATLVLVKDDPCTKQHNMVQTYFNDYRYGCLPEIT